jgi:Ni,Fe-hydrogenase maturation factor
MPATLLIAIGNQLRRDDGVAHKVLDLIPTSPRLDSLRVFQLTAEVASAIASYHTVIFIDADLAALDLSIQPLDELPYCPMITHFTTPAEIVTLSRELFGFAGLAFLCRIPAKDISCGVELSLSATAYALQAAGALENWFR